ncbi:MAG: heme exporter protein CcmD [Pseudomonadales bacterium]
MGGHGLYVWLSYGAALIMMLYNVISVRFRLRRFFRQSTDQERRSARAGERPGGRAVLAGAATSAGAAATETTATSTGESPQP